MKPGENIRIDITETDNGYFVSVVYSHFYRINDHKVFTEASQLHDFVRNVMNLNFPPRQDPQDSTTPPAAPSPHQSLG